MKIPAWDAALKLFASAAAALLLSASPVAAQTSDLVARSVLRVCSDPANLPFSDDKGQGFENKIAELLAADLGIPIEYTWFPQATGFIRMTLGAKACDVVIGYAAGGDPVQNTNPYYRSAFVLVYRIGQGLDGVESLSDEKLKDKRLGVIAGTPPSTILALNGLMAKAKPYALTVDRRFEAPAEQMMNDLVNGEIDGALLWGPIAGHYVRRTRTPTMIVPLLKERRDLPMTFRITLGLRAGELEWKRRLNEFIAARQNDINKILLEFNVPLLDEQDKPIVAAQ